MSNKEKFEGMKRGLVENNERKYGAEVRDRWGNAAAEDANRKMLKLSKAQFDRFQSLEREIGSVLGRAGDDRLAPRPRAPRTPRARPAPKWLSASQASAMRARGMPWWRLTVSRLRPVGGAAESAVASARNSLGSSLNLRSERYESLTYLFLGAFLLPMA